MVSCRSRHLMGVALHDCSGHCKLHIILYRAVIFRNVVPGYLLPESQNFSYSHELHFRYSIAVIQYISIIRENILEQPF